MANFTNHPPTRQRPPCQTNQSGIPGITFTLRDYGVGRIPYVQVAYVDENGAERRYQRSVEAHGIEATMRFALKMRRKMGVKKLPTLYTACSMFTAWFSAAEEYR